MKEYKPSTSTCLERYCHYLFEIFDKSQTLSGAVNMMCLIGDKGIQ